MQHLVNICDFKITGRLNDILVTYSLGSCIGVTFYDPVKLIGGMIHCMLPLSAIDLRKAERNPAMFVDTGVRMMLREFRESGSEYKDILVKVAGASALLNDGNLLKTGERNYSSLKMTLNEFEIPIVSEDVFGTRARSLFFYMDGARTVVKLGGKEKEI